VSRRELSGVKPKNKSVILERGDCDPPETKGKKIRIAKDLSPQEELEVVIHESLHAADWYKDEEWVEVVAKDISNLLWRIGWRKEDL